MNTNGGKYLHMINKLHVPENHPTQEMTESIATDPFARVSEETVRMAMGKILVTPKSSKGDGPFYIVDRYEDATAATKGEPWHAFAVPTMEGMAELVKMAQGDSPTE